MKRRVSGGRAQRRPPGGACSSPSFCDVEESDRAPSDATLKTERLNLCMSWTHFQLLPDLFCGVFFPTIFFFSVHFFFSFFFPMAPELCLKWRNVSRVSAAAPVVLGVLAVPGL